jgi:hypothetical protein
MGVWGREAEAGGHGGGMAKTMYEHVNKQIKKESYIAFA